MKKPGPRGSAPFTTNATSGDVADQETFLIEARARSLETATERCADLLTRLEGMFPKHDFSPFFEDDAPVGDDFAAAYVSDLHRIAEPEPRLLSALVAVAYCVAGMRADIAGEERKAWHATLRAEGITGFIAGHRASGNGVALDEAVKAEMRALQSRKAASQKRPNARRIDRDMVLSEFRRLVREGHTEGQARGILASRGDSGSYSSIHRITQEK